MSIELFENKRKISTEAMDYRLSWVEYSTELSIRIWLDAGKGKI